MSARSLKASVSLEGLFIPQFSPVIFPEWKFYFQFWLIPILSSYVGWGQFRGFDRSSFGASCMCMDFSLDNSFWKGFYKTLLESCLLRHDRGQILKFSRKIEIIPYIVVTSVDKHVVAILKFIFQFSLCAQTISVSCVTLRLKLHAAIE